jgi:hypothetical protein
MKLIKIFSLALLFFLLSCDDNAPRIYTSIEGVWRCEEINSSVGTQRSYLLDIYQRSDTTQYVITNFFNTGDDQTIVVRLKAGKLSMIEDPTANITVKSFSGTVDNLKQIRLNYTVFDGQRDNAVNAVFSRN